MLDSQTLNLIMFIHEVMLITSGIRIKTTLVQNAYLTDIHSKTNSIRQAISIRNKNAHSVASQQSPRSYSENSGSFGLTRTQFSLPNFGLQVTDVQLKRNVFYRYFHRLSLDKLVSIIPPDVAPLRQTRSTNFSVDPLFCNHRIYTLKFVAGDAGPLPIISRPSNSLLPNFPRCDL